MAGGEWQEDGNAKGEVREPICSKKYKLVDREDPLSNEWSEPFSKEEALDQIGEWNEQMGTSYSSIGEFNLNEEYWQWEEC